MYSDNGGGSSVLPFCFLVVKRPHEWPDFEIKLVGFIHLAGNTIMKKLYVTQKT